MSDLLAIDPSIVSPGVALFRDAILIANACIKVKPDKSANQATRAIIAADAIVKWVHEQRGQPGCIAYEWPQIYKGDGPAVANAVISMAAVDAAVTTALMIGAMKRGHELEIQCAVPAEIWGQLPKAKTGSYWKCPRGIRVYSRLTSAEQLVAVDQHDAGDAVGIGLWALSRLVLRRVLVSS